MREKKTLNKFLIYNYTELNALKEYLEEMALKGWILVYMNTWLTFKKAEPQKIIYSIEIDESASFYDRFNRVKDFENMEECMKKGWIFTAGFGKLRVYKTKNENAIPIIKDEKEKLGKIIRSTQIQRIMTWIILPILILFDVFLINLTNSDSMFITKIIFNIFFVIVYLCIAIHIIRFVVWKYKTKTKLEKLGSIEVYNLTYLKRKNIIIKIAYVISFILLMILDSILYAIKDQSSAIMVTYFIICLLIAVFFNLIINRLSIKK